MSDTPQSALRGRWLIVSVVLVVLAALTFALALADVWTRAPQTPLRNVEVTVARGAPMRQVAQQLQDAGLVANARLFEILARTIGGGERIHYGVYAFAEGEGWGSILARLQRGDTLVIPVVIPEGMPSIQVAERLNAAPRLSGEVAVPAEGSVYPATYDSSVGGDRAAVLQAMQRKMTAELDRLWAARGPDLAVRDKQEAVILASIVEKETAVASERRRIAGLYSNRLKQGMPLQADPTVIYPITRGKPLGRRILRSELDSDNPYNTYRHAGLPPGPITNPGGASIEAVLHPERHDYLYMVADGSGGHVFARSYAEHQANVARWRAHRREAGI